MYKTLVDCHTLALHLHDPDWVVVDCRFTLTDPDAGRRAYDAGHIPGARYAHLDDDLSSAKTPRTGRHPLPDPAVLADKLGTWGIGAGRQVVAHDDAFGAMAARLWWLLRWLGHDAVALLDGGLPRWQREGHPVTPELPVVRPATFVPRTRLDMVVDADFVARVVQNKDWLVMDARAEERFNGEVEPLDPVAGHIPGAVNLPYEDNLHVSGRFESPDALRTLYRGQMRNVASDHVIQMCGSGVTACHNLLAMEHAGLTGARLYAGSWSEWIRDPARPVARDPG
jgi:thiosulfate/3-mercaptopyruvate sulfurtransferase